MLKRIRIVNLGPHTDFRAELDPRGENTVTGPSEAGKSFLVEAVLFVLYGRSTAGRFRPEAVSDDASRALVELTLDSGMTLRRTITRTRSTTRTIALGNDETSYGSEAKFAEALGVLGRDPEAVTVVMQPMAWQELAAGNARNLRDLLARILPSAGVEDEVKRLVEEAGHTISDADAALDDKAAGSRRREARKLRDESTGRLQLARERLATLLDATQAAGPESTPDPALIERIEAWEAYDQATRTVAGAAAQRARVAEWDRRLEALGPEPAEPPPLDGAALAAEQQKMHQAMQVAQQVGANQQMLTMQRQMFGAGTDVCPTCQRPGWTDGAQMAQQLDAQLATLADQVTAANTAWQQAQAALASLQTRQQEVRAAQVTVDTWRRSRRALGERPPEPSDIDVPAPPPSDRPTDEEVASTRQLLSRIAAAGELEQRRRDELEEARKAVQQEQDRLEQAEAEAGRWDAILEAIRQAPSLVAAKQARALGDMGPVTLTFDENPAVSVWIDGRPWWLASRGRQVVADACFRNALRRALQLPHLPIFVDNVQDVGGQPLPPIPGPVIWLQTTDGKGLFVRRKTSRGDSSLSP